MALLPMIMNELLHEHLHPRRQLADLYDQNFGLGMEDLDYILPAARQTVSIPGLRAGYLRPWRNVAAGDSGMSSIKSDDKEFSVKLDVTHFKPEELSVKLGDGNSIVIEGKHEERSDEHGFISRQFTRRYVLPEDVLTDTLSSNLSSDGVLTLQAAKKPKETNTGREIKIVKTNQPARKDEPAKVEQKKEETPQK